MPRGDWLAVLQYMMATRPLLDLSATVWHTRSSDTLCSVIDRHSIQWCRANYLHQAGPLLQKRPVDELPESPSRTCSCPTVSSAMVDQLHDVPHSTRAPT
jgi:hypothetical protein